MRPTLVFQDQAIEPEAFEQRWQRSAAALQAAGVRDGDVVALMLRNSPLAVELMLAARHLGAQWAHRKFKRPPKPGSPTTRPRPARKGRLRQ